jgi:TatD DNase family protein
MAKRPVVDYPAPPEALVYPVTDNHTHIEPGQRPGGLEPGGVLNLAEQVERAKAVGVHRIVQCGCEPSSAEWTAREATSNPAVVGAIAIHPNLAPRLEARGAYTTELEQIERLALDNPRVRAIGETGLDYYRTRDPEAQAFQRAAFRDHIALAKRLDLAMQIHDRDAHRDVVQVLRSDGAPPRTVFHCFSGDVELARLCSERGWWVSVAGTVTFAANDALRQAVAAVPLELLLVETDAPYLTPHPFRGRPNAPYMVPYTVRALARLKDVTEEEMCQTLESNTTAVYGLW